MELVSKGTTSTGPDQNQPVKAIMFNFNKEDKKKPYSQQKQIEFLENLQKSKLWLATGYTGIRYPNNKYELFAENDEKMNPKRAKEALEAMKFQVEHLDHYLVATRSTGLSLDKIQKIVKASEELDNFQEGEGWQVVGFSNEIEPWVLVPKEQP